MSPITCFQNSQSSRRLKSGVLIWFVFIPGAPFPSPIKICLQQLNNWAFIRLIYQFSLKECGFSFKINFMLLQKEIKYNSNMHLSDIKSKFIAQSLVLIKHVFYNTYISASYVVSLAWLLLWVNAL